MGTDKRERQKQNREAKKAEEAKAATRQRRIDLARRWAFYVLLFVVAIVILYFVTG
jgi:t-SNARE complex subunit (syntaxin)